MDSNRGPHKKPYKIYLLLPLLPCRTAQGAGLQQRLDPLNSNAYLGAVQLQLPRLLLLLLLLLLLHHHQIRRII
jgi:hypothetical protein